MSRSRCPYCYQPVPDRPRSPIIENVRSWIIAIWLALIALVVAGLLVNLAKWVLGIEGGGA